VRKWCVGIAVDAEGGKFCWSQKGPATPVIAESFGLTSIASHSIT